MKALLVAMSYFFLSCLVTIGPYTYSRASQIQIRKSSKSVGDSATIVLGSFRKQEGPNVRPQDKIKEGMAVTIQLGYGGESNLKTEFVGFVKSVNPNVPMVIECEDYIYKLRRKYVKEEAAFANGTTLKDLLSFIVKDTGISLITDTIPEISFDKFRLDYTAAGALERFCQEYGLLAYFRGNRLYCGFRYLEKPARRVRLAMDVNVVATNLAWRTTSESRVRVKAVRVLPDGTRKTYNVGPEDGELITLTFHNLASDQSLVDIARQEIQKRSYIGYEGTITTLGLPLIDHGDSIVLVDPDFPGRNGTYHSESVVIDWGQSGFRRTVTLGLKLS